MNRLLQRTLLVCVYLFALTGQANAEPLSEIDVAASLGDYEKVAKLLRLQAEQGNATAQAQLGDMYHIGDIYHKGKGVRQDYKEALKWYRLAAEQGNPFAQYRLGFMYSRGEGVTKDFVLAHMWANISSANNPSSTPNNFEQLMSVGLRDSMEEQMTAGQIAEAQQLARKCTANKYKGC